MNYRHAYHAGNFADVFKHVVLIALTKALLRKETGFCYLDTHAGAGRYDLLAETTQKSKEYENGIGKILAQPHQPTLIKEYLQCFEGDNLYPGSPLIVRHFLRPQDRMVLCELHPEEHLQLKRVFNYDKQVAIHNQDGYLGLKSFLPPKEKRGLILIDPPYEKPNELEFLINELTIALKRFATGVYAIWYPLKNRLAVERFLRSLKEKINHPLLIAELSIYPEDIATHLYGNGMAIINPPWQLDEELKSILPWLWQTLSINEQGGHTIKVST